MPAHPVTTLLVVTHRDREVAASSIHELIEAAHSSGVQLVAMPADLERHPELATSAARSTAPDLASAAVECDAILVLAGDGTLLWVLGLVGDGPPVLGVNHGIVGYLAGASSDHISVAIERLVRGEYDVVKLPRLMAHVHGEDFLAINDIVVSGGVTGGIIEVAWSIGQPTSDGGRRVDPMGVVPCDGMVIATPVGSTAYNLSNGGPVMAWGTGGFVVSFIAPHTLSARPLVVESEHSVFLEHMGRGAPLRVLVDGREVGTISAGETMSVGIGGPMVNLAHLGDQSFYARYRDHFALPDPGFDRARARAARGLRSPAATRGTA